MKYVVRLERDLTEYTTVEVEAESSGDAMEEAMRIARSTDSPLQWEAGNDRDGPFIAEVTKSK